MFNGLMLWQDWVFSIGQWVFGLSLIPLVRAKEKPPLLTSVPSAFFLTLFVFAQYSLNLYMAAISTLVVAAMWWFIAYQKYLRKKKKN